MVAVLSNLILGFPWTVGFMLGFVLAAVSPAVIIPCLMSLSSKGYGVAKGIPTLVIAACSADDVVAISGFGIFFGLTFSKGAPLWKLILHGPIEVINWCFLWCVVGSSGPVDPQQRSSPCCILQMAGSAGRRAYCTLRSSSHPLRWSWRPGHHHHGFRGRHAVEEGGVGRSQSCHKDIQEDVDHP